MNSSTYQITYGIVDSLGRHVQVQVVKLTEQLQAQRDLFDLLIIGEPNCSQQGLDKLNESKKEQGYKSNLQQVLQKFADNQWPVDFDITQQHVNTTLSEADVAKTNAASGIEIGQDECWMSSADRTCLSYEGITILGALNKRLPEEKKITAAELVNIATSSASSYDSYETFLGILKNRNTPKMTAGLEALEREGEGGNRLGLEEEVKEIQTTSPRCRETKDQARKSGCGLQ